MNRQPITLHPSMTAQQIAEWCAQRRMIVTIEYLQASRSQVVPVIRAIPFDEPKEMPAFLRRQAD